jgi:hypothetical protein
MSRAVRLATLALVALGGCLPLDQFRSESDLPQVPTSPFPPSVVQTVKRANPDFAPAAQEINLRVDAVGRKLLAANPQTGLKPLFATLGVPGPEVFHVDPTLIYVTEGLVRQCKSEAELAAVLAVELGRMVSEREAVAAREARVAEPRQPIPLPIGGQGNPYSADPSYFVEMAKFEKDHPRSARNKILPPPDPRVVAGSLLEQAGFHKSDLEAVGPILLSAERNCTLERQFKGIVSESGVAWRPQ